MNSWSGARRRAGWGGGGRPEECPTYPLILLLTPSGSWSLSGEVTLACECHTSAINRSLSVPLVVRGPECLVETMTIPFFCPCLSFGT